MKKSEDRTILHVAVGAVVVIALVVVICSLFGGSGKSSVSTSEIHQGVAFLEQQEQGDVSVVQGKIREIQQKKEAAARSQRRKQFEDGQIDVWELFRNYAILGDSRSEGFIDFGYLSSERVLAGKGDNIDKIPEHMDKLKALNPSQIFICYGMNDLTNNIGGSPEGWVARYGEYIDLIRQNIPGTEIYVNDIMAPQDAAYAVSGNLANYAQYNEVLKTMCKAKGVHYIDTTETTSSNADLYAPDGIHFNYDFYPYWAADMQLAVMGEDETDVNSGSEKDQPEEAGEGLDE
uniref:SGNH/GDSL hydrolase family protein n=1 Tax=Eubacterium cellulosolvens TaxID=29322 RepID=UPI00047F6409|nr:GDSL-type esterase/lipase family protein [[Eubacterium] cellulosolvens]